MSVSEDIRALAREGLTVAEIARRLGIRYQHAYKVLKDDGLLPEPRTGLTTVANVPARASVKPKPSLSVEELVRGGFEFSGRWMLSDAGDLKIDRPLPRAVGVYAVVKDGIVLYIGVATMGLAKRLYFYGKPGITQRTSQRLNGILKSELLAVPFIDIYTAFPP
jgi:hypothetical protein